MQPAEFYDLHPPDIGAGTGWQLPVVRGLCTGGNFLFGGCALGAAVAALETETGRPLRWASAQYLDYARPDQVVDIDVTVAASGRNTAQARALLTVGGTEIISVNAAFGERPHLGYDGQWVDMPSVPSPEDCDPRDLREDHTGTIMSRLEMRLADARPLHALDGSPGGGRSALWARIPDLVPHPPAALAVLADYVPFGIGQALGLPAGGNSLDNSLRIVHWVPSEWVLIDVRVSAISDGFGHGAVYLWSTDGALLAVGSQTTIVRFWGGSETEALRMVEELRDARD